MALIVQRFRACELIFGGFRLQAEVLRSGGLPADAGSHTSGFLQGLGCTTPAPLLLLVLLAGCSQDAKPIDVRAGDACAHCRMTVSDARFAGQIVAPGEEPLFYDDLGCLTSAVEAGKPLEFAFVADHRTGEWVPARNAVYTHVPVIETPMGSNLLAHASDESRRADRSSSGGKPMTSAQVFPHAH